LKIQGRVNEDLYYRVPFFGPAPKEAPSAGQPAVVAAGTLTVNEERILSAGEEWTYQVQPTEVVTVNIRALDGGELVFVVSRWGREEKRSLKASDPLGVTVAFQNR
jgi:hypothetical protein